MSRTAQIREEKQQSIITLRTTTRMEDPELLLMHKFIRVTGLRNCSPNKCFTKFKQQTHLNIIGSEETA
jgi:hypothetical protein